MLSVAKKTGRMQLCVSVCTYVSCTVCGRMDCSESMYACVLFQQCCGSEIVLEIVCLQVDWSVPEFVDFLPDMSRHANTQSTPPTPPVCFLTTWN